MYRIGQTYNSKNQHKQAIIWYKKCLVINPQYEWAVNGIGLSLKMLREDKEALDWFFKAYLVNYENGIPLSNAIVIFDELKYSDDDIIQETKKYPDLNSYQFYYGLGDAYNHKGRA